jgi:heptosyltransferase-3
MGSILERLPSGARVVVIRLRSLGDCVLTTPALHILKRARPDLKVAVVVEDAFAPVFEGNPDVERIVAPSVPDVAALHPELVLNLHGGSRSAQLTFACRARFRAGFTHFRFRAMYNVRIPRAQDILGVDRHVHTAEHLASAMFYLGVLRCEIPRARLFSVAQASRPVYAVIHPVASSPEKTWPATNFLAVAARLKKEGLDPVFIAGPNESLAEFSAYRCISGAPLAEIKSLLASAAMFIGNDSGPAHMAAAFGIPSVVLFGPSHEEIWAPWKTEAVVLKAPDITTIAVEQVTGALPGLLI